MNTPCSPGKTFCLLAGSLMAAALSFTGLSAQTTATYNGGACAIDFYGATLGDAVIADTGDLPPSGGQFEQSYGAYASPTLSLTKASSYTYGGQNVTFSGTVVEGLTVHLIGQSGAAYTLTSSTVASCAWAAANGVNDGLGLCLDLKLNGKPIVVTGAPNQTIAFDGWTLVLNEHVPASASNTTSIQVNALHLTGPADWDFAGISSAIVVAPPSNSTPRFTGVPVGACAWLLDECAPLFLECWGSM